MKTLVLSVSLAAAGVMAGQTQLTIYNQNFASVKETRTFVLTQAENEVRVTDITAHLEPDSVVLRDLKDPGAISILEQNYESDPLSEGLLLRKCEGKEIDFEVMGTNGLKQIVKGRILRSGYVPHVQAYQRYGTTYASTQRLYSDPQYGGQAVVEVDGSIKFGLPGTPLFAALDEKAFLKPTLLWRVAASEAGARECEFSYLTGGMRWEASYNAVASGEGDRFDLVGWVTLENMSGKDFENASIKLMAGDVARAKPQPAMAYAGAASLSYRAAGNIPPAVTQRAFDEYHLYTLERATTVLDREIKQVEFVRAPAVPAERFYVYDGYAPDTRYGSSYDSPMTSERYGTMCNPKVWVMLQLTNAASAGLGIPLPKGTVKLYRRDVDGRNEFIGEDTIDHTPVDETVRLGMGNAFDLVGERKQTSFKMDHSSRWIDESFEINVRNHKAEPVEVRVVEHLYRWVNWEIRGSTMEYRKTDSRTIEFRPTVPTNGQAIINYTVHYTW